MKLNEIFKNISYRGQAEGDRNTYYIFETSSHYVVLSPNSTSGFNMNLVDREVPDVIRKKFSGQRVTGPLLRRTARRPDLFKAPFGPLNALYVMVGLGLARKLRQHQGKAMVFKIR